MLENEFENKALRNLDRLVKDIFKGVGEGSKLVNQKLSAELTPEEKDKFKAYLKKYLKLKKLGKHKKAEELEKHFLSGK